MTDVSINDVELRNGFVYNKTDEKLGFMRGYIEINRKNGRWDKVGVRIVENPVLPPDIGEETKVKGEDVYKWTNVNEKNIRDLSVDNQLTIVHTQIYGIQDAISEIMNNISNLKIQF